MGQLTVRSTVYQRVIISFLVLAFSAAYVLFSYHQKSTRLAATDQTLFFKDQQQIQKAFEEFDHFLNLTETRLLNSYSKEDLISSILSFKPEHFMNPVFPKILNLIFVPASTPNIVYSRFGTTFPNHRIDLLTIKNGITYSGAGKFRTDKTLYDSSGKLVGVLQSTFSIAHILYKNFSEHKFSIKPLSHSQNNHLSFSIPQVPYTFSLNREPFSFRQYTADFKAHLISTLLFGIILLFSVLTASLAFHQQLLLKWRSLYQALKDKTKEQQLLETQLLASHNLLKLKDQSKRGISQFYTALQERHHHMVGQAHAINIVTSKLISEDTKNNHLLKEIHSISQESNVILRLLMKGHLIKYRVNILTLHTAWNI